MFPAIEEDAPEYIDSVCIGDDLRVQPQCVEFVAVRKRVQEGEARQSKFILLLTQLLYSFEVSGLN